MQILVIFVQMLGLISRIQAFWDTVILQFLGFVDITSTSQNWTSLDCLLPGDSAIAAAYARSIAVVLQPVTTFVVLMLIWVAIYGLRRFKWGKQSNIGFMATDESGLRDYLKEHLTVTLFSVLLYYYSSVTAQLLGLFACRKLDLGGASHYAGFMTAVGAWWTQVNRADEA